MIVRAILSSATAFLLGGSQAAVNGGRIQWLPEKDYDRALAQARDTGKPVILYFTADW